MQVKKILYKVRSHIVFRNMAALFTLQIVGYIFPLLTLPILTRSLGVEQFGFYIWIMAVISMANVVTDYGFSLSATYQVATHQKDKIFLGQLLGNILATKIVLSTISATLVIIYFSLFSTYFHKLDAQMWLLLILIALVIVTQSFQISWFFQGIERMKMITLTVFLAKVSYLILVAALVPLFKSVMSAYLCIAINNCIVAGLYYYFVHKSGYQFSKWKLAGIVKELKDGVGIFTAQLSSYSYSKFNIIILGIYAGPHVTALYGAAEKCYSAGMSLLGPINQAFYPHTAKTGDLRLLVKITLLLSFPLAIACLCMAYFAPEILNLLFGQSYTEGANILRGFILLIFISFFTWNLGYTAYAAFDKIYLVNRFVYAASGLYFLLLSALILNTKITAIHVLCVFISSEIFILVFILLFLYKIQRSKCKKKT